MSYTNQLGPGISIAYFPGKTNFYVVKDIIVEIELVGGGGAGGQYRASSVAYAFGGGGGAGAYNRISLNLDRYSSLSVVVPEKQTLLGGDGGSASVSIKDASGEETEYTAMGGQGGGRWDGASVMGGTGGAGGAARFARNSGEPGFNSVVTPFSAPSSIPANGGQSVIGNAGTGGMGQDPSTSYTLTHGSPGLVIFKAMNNPSN